MRRRIFPDGTSVNLDEVNLLVRFQEWVEFEKAAMIYETPTETAERFLRMLDAESKGTP